MGAQIEKLAKPPQAAPVEAPRPRAKTPQEIERLYESGDHHRDFLGAIRSRRDPVASVEAGHAATTLTIVSDIATRLGRKLTWDWRRERFLGDDEANRMLSRSLRAPWSI